MLNAGQRIVKVEGDNCLIIYLQRIRCSYKIGKIFFLVLHVKEEIPMFERT